MLSKAYLFKGPDYVRWDILRDKCEYKTSIAKEWVSKGNASEGLAAVGFDRVDAAINWGNGKAYLFRGPDYVRWDILTDKCEYKTSIAKEWVSKDDPSQGLAALGFGDGIDGAVNWGNGKAYFFKGAEYVRWDILTDTCEYKASIAKEWVSKDDPSEGLSAVGFDRVDAAINWGNGKAYLFKGPEYVRWDIAADKCEYKASVAQEWVSTDDPSQGLAALGFADAIDAAVNWGRHEWHRIEPERRLLYVMERLVEEYGYPVNGAAGLTGNLFSESALIPSRIQTSAEATPLRAAGFDGRTKDFTAEEVKNRSQSRRIGPRPSGIGIAQWTEASRRSGLFAHQVDGHTVGAPILFEMAAQIDYAVHELATGFAGVDAVLRNPAVGVDQASDEVAYDYETPGTIAPPGERRRPRDHPDVQAEFVRRRPFAHQAERAYRAAHP